LSFSIRAAAWCSADRYRQAVRLDDCALQANLLPPLLQAGAGEEGSNSRQRLTPYRAAKN
jgi:hypothetical protein